MAKRGRPKDLIIPLLKDRKRFAVAIWFFCTEYLGLGPYDAADLTIFLITSHTPITIESIDGVLLKASTDVPPTATREAQADWIARKSRKAIERADQREWAWLTMSAGLMSIMMQRLAEGDSGGFHLACGMLRNAGWDEALDRVVKRLDASLRSNFPPAVDWKPRRAAARLLRRVKAAS